eukprot:Platyproteum_vivax@DN12247_c0_g1_i1.p1
MDLLGGIRERLIRLEETIIFAIIERSAFAINEEIYVVDENLSNVAGCFLDFFFRETEKVHAKMRRYRSPEENAFYEDLPEPLFQSTSATPKVLKPNNINYNQRIKSYYLHTLLRKVARKGSDNELGSSALADINCMQAISKRVHFGKFVAEAKFQSDVESYSKLIRARDNEGLLLLLTNQ